MVVASGILFYLIKSSKDRNKKDLDSFNDNVSIGLLADLKLTDEQIEVCQRIKSQIKMERQVGMISAQTVLAINDLILNHLKDKYIDVLKSDKAKRRQLLGSLQSYVDNFVKQQETLDSLLERANENILREIGLNLNEFEAICSNITKQNPQFEQMVLMKLEQLRFLAFPFRNRILKEEEMIGYYKLQNQIYQSLDLSMINLELESLINIKTNYISDYAAVHLNIENEDILGNQMLLTLPSVQSAMMNLQVSIQKDMQRSMTRLNK